MNGSDQILVFDHVQRRRNLRRVAARFAAHRVLFDETDLMLRERLADVKVEFNTVLEWGAREKRIAGGLVSFDDECLPFAPHTFDLVLSNLALHWVNDLPGVLAQIKYALKPNGLFLAAMLGGATLQELRICLTEAEMNVTGGISPRFSPMVDTLTASRLMQRAGFNLPVMDQEKITLTYTDLYALMRDLRGMGENNAHIHRLRRPTRRAVFAEAARLYKERFQDVTGRIPATFEVIFLHGWR